MHQAIPVLAEISDQNFVNEDEEGEEADQSSMNVAKRMKIVEGGSSSADQVINML